MAAREREGVGGIRKAACRTALWYTVSREDNDTRNPFVFFFFFFFFGFFFLGWLGTVGV